MTTQNFKVRNGAEIGNVVINSVTGNVGNVGNLQVRANSYLGNVSNVKITGGSYLNYAVTDGAGNLSFLPQSPAANAAVSFTLEGNVNTVYGNYDLVTVNDPATSTSYSVSLYPGNTPTSAASYLVSAVGSFTYTASSQGNVVTYVNKVAGQLGSSQLPTMTITPASNGNSTLTATRTVISFGQGTTGPAGTVESRQYGNTTQSPSLRNNFFITPYFLGTTTNVALAGLGLTYYYNSATNNYLLNTSGSTIIFQVSISFTAPTASSFITFWPIVDFNNTAPGYTSFPTSIQATSNMYPAMFVSSLGGTSANVAMTSTMISLPANGTMSLYAWLLNSVTIGSANPSWPISNTKIQFTRLK